MQGPDRVRSVVCERPVSRGRRVGIRILGTVQGVGFRPFVYRLARAHGLGGWVRNDGDGVAAEVEGAAADVHRFLARIVREAPPLAVVARVATRELTPCGDRDFAVVPSATAGTRSTAIAADAATCAECLRELFDPADRRFRYPFINCTGCGPRFTIVEAVPWDRAGTTMAAFAMCAACRAEYEDPAARRFHAEPNACPACGPRLRLVDGGGRPVAGDPLAVAAAALRGGAIVAVKGLGGFHLACRADDAGAVGRL